MPGARRVMMGVPALRMRYGHPTQELRDLAVLASPWPHDHVPVIGHDAVSENPQRHSQKCLFQDTLEGSVVFLLQKQSGARVGAIQDVISVASLDRSGSSWHRVG